MNKLIISIAIMLTVFGCRKDPIPPTPDDNNISNWYLHVLSSGGAIKDGHKVQFFGNETVYVGGYSNSLYPTGVSWYSTNNGASWNGAFGNFEGQPINTISLINDSSAYIVSCHVTDLHLKYTNDYCLSFSHNPLGAICAPTNNTTAIHFFNDSIGFVGDRRTQDGGQTWTCSTLPSSSYYFFLNDSLGYACSGNDLLQTSDTGWTWVTSYSGSANLMEVNFFDESNGLLLAGTDLLKSTDGGVNWIPIKTEVSSYFFSDSQTGFATSANKIFKTTDSGNSWTQVFETDKINFIDIAWRGNTAIAVGKQLNATEDGEYFIAITNDP